MRTKPLTASSKTGPTAEARIAVTGATGVVGGRVGARLSAAGIPQRLVVRDKARAPELPGAEVRQASGYGAFDEMRAALDGVDTVFLVSGEKAHDRVEQHVTAVQAAAAAGVSRLVYLSMIGASADSLFERSVEHWQIEEHIRSTDLQWTLLRMNLFIDLIPTMVHPDGAIKGPGGYGRFAAVAREDVAASAAAVLTSDGHEGKTYELTGSESLSLGEAAECMAQVTGKPIRYVDETDEEAYASRSGFGAPEWIVRGWISSYWAIRAGELERVSPAVRDLTGLDPITLEQYMHDHPEALDNVGEK
jgi:uncharacterized protein YbjT (DUF2867 family)